MSNHRSTVVLSDVPAAIAAARERTGREVGAVVADLAACSIHHKDLTAAIEQLVSTSRIEAAAVARKVGALRLAADPGATIKAAGVVIRRTEPQAELEALTAAHAASLKEGTERVTALQTRANALVPLIEEFIAELGRAGVPRHEVQPLLDSATITRVTKAA
jgi:hypothetical protein